MVEQAKILEHDADAPPERGDLVLVEFGGVLAENTDGSARRAQRQQHQPQQRRLAGAGRPGEELKALRRDGEIEVADDLGADAVAQADILKA